MRSVDIRASAVPDIALCVVILDLGVVDLQEGEVIACRNKQKKRSHESSVMNEYFDCP